MKLRLAGIVAVVFMTSAFVHACSCVTVPSHGPCEGLPKSGFLFIGTVISITPEQPPEVQADGTLVEYFGGDRKVTLRVDERFAGALGPEFEVTTGSGGGDCGYPFELGGSYLVEADIWKVKPIQGSALLHRRLNAYRISSNSLDGWARENSRPQSTVC